MGENWGLELPWNWNLEQALVHHGIIFIFKGKAKNVVYLVNLSEQDFLNKKNKWLGKIKEWIDHNVPGDIIPFSAEYEKNLFEEFIIYR